MRLLLFMESYYCGGVDTFVINLINNWPGDADELILACNTDHAGLENIKTSLKRPCRVIENKMKIFTGFFVKIRKLSVFDRCLFLILKLLAPILRYLFLIYNIFALRRVFGQIGADRLLVINGGYPGGDSCRAATISWGLLREKPLSIHNFHGIVTKPRWHIKIQEYFVDALMSKFTKTFVTVSDAAAKTMSCRKIIYKNNKILTVYSGIELNQNETTLDIKREIGMPIDGHLCLMLGNYNYNKNFNKGHYFLFSAFKKVLFQIPNAYLLVCGHGSTQDIDRVKQMAFGLNLINNVYFSGFRKDINSIWKHIDILLFSAQAFESFGFAVIEAMAHYVPVVATNVGAIPELIQNEEGGYSVDKKDADSFASHVITLLKNENLRRQQGEKAYLRYQNFFTATKMSKEYYKLLHE